MFFSKQGLVALKKKQKTMWAQLQSGKHIVLVPGVRVSTHTRTHTLDTEALVLLTTARLKTQAHAPACHHHPSFKTHDNVV